MKLSSWIFILNVIHTVLPLGMFESDFTLCWEWPGCALWECAHKMQTVPSLSTDDIYNIIELKMCLIKVDPYLQICRQCHVDLLSIWGHSVEQQGVMHGAVPACFKSVKGSAKRALSSQLMPFIKHYLAILFLFSTTNNRSQWDIHQPTAWH